ncbi:hypothetical protein PJK45_24495 [Mycobacterium kansasii]|uniref:Uncharacterized protein n=1 Tax=Mycobacterium kansasii ATCC 12478 TaxID=557599 RepID=U5WYB3_MYCKA|nr:hypothetical protein [Mycobacterium kansasii]AGZ54084.1 hypothetical protein MKAN_07555 [Mycobacterium kansasii ATCC 12478]
MGADFVEHRPVGHEAITRVGAPISKACQHAAKDALGRGAND